MVAVITGASGGLGRELAGQLAAKGWDLLLTARRPGSWKPWPPPCGRPTEWQSRCVPPIYPGRRRSAPCYGPGADLPVGLVINNAGAGQIGASSDIPWEAEEALLTANMLAPCRLTKAFAASMERGCILNVASLAGFQPEPGMASYAASKAFLLQWSRAVGYELKREGRPVRLGRALPGTAGHRLRPGGRGQQPSGVACPRPAAPASLCGAWRGGKPSSSPARGPSCSTC